MTDLISRQAAIEHLKKRLYETELNSYAPFPYYAEMADNRVSVWINEVPTIDPAENGGCWGCCCEKLGQWRTKELDKFRKYEVVCSECGAKYIGNYDAYDEPCEFNYCPNCGARMEIE